jgi:hypothetical protein
MSNSYFSLSKCSKTPPVRHPYILDTPLYWTILIGTGEDPIILHVQNILYLGYPFILELGHTFCCKLDRFMHFSFNAFHRNVYSYFVVLNF